MKFKDAFQCFWIVFLCCCFSLIDLSLWLVNLETRKHYLESYSVGRIFSLKLFHGCLNLINLLRVVFYYLCFIQVPLFTGQSEELSVSPDYYEKERLLRLVCEQYVVLITLASFTFVVVFKGTRTAPSQAAR